MRDASEMKSQNAKIEAIQTTLISRMMQDKKPERKNKNVFLLPSSERKQNLF
jgi:hypothetical protein